MRISCDIIDTSNYSDFQNIKLFMNTYFYNKDRSKETTNKYYIFNENSNIIAFKTITSIKL